MFEVPEAKRVRREDLNGSDNGAENESDDGIQDAELRARLNAQIARSLGLDDSYVEQPSDVVMQDSHPMGSKESGDDDTAGAEAAEDDHEEEFAFRLFSKAPPTQKVVLEEDTGPTGDGTFVSGRPLSYYVVTNVPAHQKQEYAIAAMSGDQVLAKSHDRFWGLELPWKVTTVAVTCNATPGDKTEDAAKGKRRPGKKQRISLRKRAKAKEEKKAADAQKMAEKEEHIKDKKKRMNRLKKLRKRAKAREQKQGANEGGDNEDSDGDSAGSD
ncbi:hypothetical protein NW762_011753 [Fusarium torreyae]|uniref:Uncharacterized protein n=1 Tax=Fusarium torreyae TaxID=1237075 RepID=A0A9W8RSB4_9HYPO|nr:hypothetical protein NW762_011753 [Fusarium torreyae]